MHVYSAHADRVYLSAEQTSAAASSPVVASWRRCMTMYKLTPEDARTPLRLSEAEFALARQEAASLIAEASDEIDRLFSVVGKAGCCVLLTDRNGIALERRGTAGDDRHFRDHGLWTGTVWSEASIGTNGIGTALADERAVTIFRDEHFFSSNIDLSCTTTPIRDHRGQVTAALDISTCRSDANELTLSILAQTVRDAAQRIELNLFRRAFAKARLLMVPVGPHAATALLAVDRDDLVIGATRAARVALKLDDQRIAAGIPAEDLLQQGPERDDLALQEAERSALKRMLSRCQGNVSRAAAHLGMSRATLYRKLKKLDLH